MRVRRNFSSTVKRGRWRVAISDVTEGASAGA
jgi:hypothetical protein